MSDLSEIHKNQWFLLIVVVNGSVLIVLYYNYTCTLYNTVNNK